MSDKPHAVLVPFPTQGHLNPFLKLAKLLHHRGFYITFVNTEFNHRRLLKSKGSTLLQNLPDFRYEIIPDGLPPSDGDTTQSVPALCEYMSKGSTIPFKNLLAELNRSTTTPPITCVVADGVTSFALEVSLEMGFPCFAFWTFSACGFLGLKLCGDMTKRGITPFKDPGYLTDGSLEALVDWIPGLKNFRVKHAASFVRTTEPNSFMLYYARGAIETTASKAAGLILYTFDELESDILQILSPIFPPIYAIGPLQLLVDQISDTNLESVDFSLWKQEDECIQWLDSKEVGSVVYVNFGSIAVLPASEIQELAMGLGESGKNFLWIIRPDWLKGDSAILPASFVDETKGRGLILGWCPQEKVLNHASIGGFLTHCGWNSVMEGITAGVPFLCCPRSTDQQTNSKYISDEWGIGLEIGDELKREKIGRLVKELLDSEDGEKMKQKAREWKTKAIQSTTTPHGSSIENLNKLVQQMQRLTEEGGGQEWNIDKIELMENRQIKSNDPLQKLSHLKIVWS